MPISARARERCGSSDVARKTSQASNDAPRAALSTPIFASSRSAPVNASVAISSDTVKPMPAMAPAPATEAQPTGGRTRPPLRRVTSHAAPRMPAGLPAT